MKEIRGLIFYSNGHNGDIHYSRNFVKDIMSQMPLNAEYLCTSSTKLLKDISFLNIINVTSLQLKKLINSVEIFYDESTKFLFVNTWVGSSGAKFIQNEVGCSLTANYNKFKEIYSNLNLQLKSPDFYVPDVNWSAYDISFVDEFISKNVFKKYILVANGEVLSGQSSFVDFNFIVEKLSIKYNDVCFIMTDIKNKIYQPNIFYTSDFIKTDGGDLNEIGYLSTKVNFIIGRGSGPFCFAHNKDNLFDKNKKFLAITKYRTDGLWALPEQLPTEQAKQLWTNMFDNNTIYSIISKEIESD